MELPGIEIETCIMFIWCRNDAASRNVSVPLAEIVATHIEHELSGGDSYSIVCVRRKYIWDDSVVQFLKRSVDPHKPIRVIFHGEEAADGGGPRKEYFHLLCKSIREQSDVFFNNQQIVNFRPSVSLFHERRYYLIGLVHQFCMVDQPFPFFQELYMTI